MSTLSPNRSDPFPVFPNGPYLSEFFLLTQDSNLSHLDIDLYNRCYLPANPLPYNSKKAKRSGIKNPDYQIDKPPCKRQSAINANCYFTLNGSLASLEPEQDWNRQQSCFCTEYSFFDAVGGCQACFDEHGGVEGYHWFPPSYVSAASATYCSASPVVTGFYPFINLWAATAAAAQVPSITAADVLGTATAANLYSTPSASSTSKSSQSSSNTNVGMKQKVILALALALALALTLPPTS